MSALRVFPFIGALVAIAGVVLAIVGISTTYWFLSGVGEHKGLWQNCVYDACKRDDGGKPAAFALAGVIAMGVAALLAIFSGLARNKSDASNNMARFCGVLSVILLFASGVLIGASIFTFFSTIRTTGYSFTLMAIAQFLSFLAAMFVAHWMGHSFTVIS